MTERLAIHAFSALNIAPDNLVLHYHKKRADQTHFQLAHTQSRMECCCCKAITSHTHFVAYTVSGRDGPALCGLGFEGSDKLLTMQPKPQPKTGDPSCQHWPQSVGGLGVVPHRSTPGDVLQNVHMRQDIPAHPCVLRVMFQEIMPDD